MRINELKSNETVVQLNQILKLESKEILDPEPLVMIFFFFFNYLKEWVGQNVKEEKNNAVDPWTLRPFENTLQCNHNWIYSLFTSLVDGWITANTTHKSCLAGNHPHRMALSHRLNIRWSQIWGSMLKCFIKARMKWPLINTQLSTVLLRWPSHTHSHLNFPYLKSELRPSGSWRSGAAAWTTPPPMGRQRGRQRVSHLEHIANSVRLQRAAVVFASKSILGLKIIPHTDRYLLAEWWMKAIILLKLDKIKPVARDVFGYFGLFTEWI